MKESTTKLLKKVNDICEEGTIWKVFFGLFAALLAADLLLPALTDEKPKLWCSILAGAGMAAPVITSGKPDASGKKNRTTSTTKKNDESRTLPESLYAAAAARCVYHPG